MRWVSAVGTTLAKNDTIISPSESIVRLQGNKKNLWKKIKPKNGGGTWLMGNTFANSNAATFQLFRGLLLEL